MNRASLALATLLVALAGAAVCAARLAHAAGAGGADLSRAHVTRVAPELAGRLARSELDLLVQWFGPAPGTAPSGYTDVEERVRAAFAALEAAGGASVRTQVLRPALDDEARRHAEALGLAPFRERRVLRDGWVEAPVWSALRVVVNGQGASVVRALTPELAHGVQDLVRAAVDELGAPRPAVIALSAPPGHARLRETLRALGEVRDVEFDVDAVVPRDVDLLWWIPEREPDDRHARALETHAARGGAALVAPSRYAAHVDGTDLVLADRGVRAQALLARLGAPADDAPLLEAPPSEARDSAGAWTWHVPRSIGSRQDFRALGEQPNGTLAFAAPTALRPDVARLAERGARFVPLASSSERVFTLPAGVARVALRDLAAGAVGTAEPPRALLALLAPEDPTRGSIVVAACASPFGAQGLAEEGLAHADLVRALVLGLASPERRVLAAVARARPEPLPEASPTLRAWSRALGVGLVPALLLALGLRRGAFGARAAAARPLALLGAALAALMLAGLPTLAIGPRAGLDLARGGSAALPAELVAVARAAASEPVVIRAAFSPDAELPAEMRPLVRELTARCAALARAVDGLSCVEVDPDGAVQADAGLRRLTRTSARDETRASQSFHASLVVERGDARRVLEFAGERAFDHADFRLALALRDLALGRRARIEFASEPARLTPAEAREHYQKRGLFAPTTGDPFAAARELLAENGWEVTAVDPARPPGEGAVDGTEDGADAGALLVWMQPRREATNGYERLRRRLAAGGRALVCAQGHRIRPRLRADAPGVATLWPEPLYPDVARSWLAEAGVSLADELVFDAASGVARVRGTRADDGRLEAVDMDLASPLVLRSTPALRPPSALTAGVGDLVLTSPARVVLDPERLAAAGLAAEVVLATSARAWTWAWRGGSVPDDVLATRDAPDEPLALAAHVAGSFGGAEAPRGRLVLVGASEPFTDAHLADPGRDHARFLLQACAALGLEGEYAALLARRPSVGGYRPLDAQQRLVARAATFAAGPLFVLLLAFSWRLGRARAAVRAAGRAAGLGHGARA